ncbi:uncharacterized protein isoform X2 [Castor canadensis]|uniref:Uncharacterized protein isoform X2 n=2 Tax=Castor canadensis TaxID=51338 RepID=A0AC58KUD5_CASCN
MAASCPPARGGAWFSDCRGVLGERLRYRWAQSPGSGSGRCGLRCPGHCRGCGEQRKLQPPGALALVIVHGGGGGDFVRYTGRRDGAGLLRPGRHPSPCPAGRAWRAGDRPY